MRSKRSPAFFLFVFLSLLLFILPITTTQASPIAIVDPDTDGDGSPDSLDCAPNDSSIYPGAIEIPGDGIDQDCNGTDAVHCYLDNDMDGYGTNVGTIVVAPDGSCDTPDGEALNMNDCNDSDDSINPAQTEVIGDGVDQDCDGNETCYLDFDNDGYRPDASSTQLSPDLDCLDSHEATPSDPSNDCNDFDPMVYPGALDVPGDAIDQDCNGADAITCYVDNDQDGYGSNSGSIVIAPDGSCDTPDGEALNMNDCNDADDSINPGETEIIGDGLDQDCDGNETCYLDFDNDGYRPDAVSTRLSADLDCNDSREALPSDPINDCNDSDAAINPGVMEIPDDGMDQDCNGADAISCYLDNDQDGYGSNLGAIKVAEDGSCDTPDGEALNMNDCDDGDDSIHPAADEIIGDGVDQDCDGKETCYVDADDDGYRPDATSTILSLNLVCSDSGEASPVDPIDDCNDSDPTFFPGAPELCDGMDNDCDGITPPNEGDSDGDTALDCCDDCPDDPDKIVPGTCGCGVPDDGNNDGVPDCQNACDHNIDSDSDKTPDCDDFCPYDAAKTTPGICGCGAPDDSNSDGVPDCQDACDHSIDTDEDGVNDCEDSCPVDPEKTDPGTCGCGITDDANADGVPDCQDACDHKLDADSDGTPDCVDSCPVDPEKTEPGICGCGYPEDKNNDGIPDCQDACDHNLDKDEDGVNDCEDSCPADPQKTEPGICGCGASDDSDQDGIPDCEADPSGPAGFLFSSSGRVTVLLAGIAVLTGSGAWVIFRRNQKI